MPHPIIPDLSGRLDTAAARAHLILGPSAAGRAEAGPELALSRKGMPDDHDVRAIAAKLRAAASGAHGGAAGRDADAEAEALSRTIVRRAQDAMLRLLSGTSDGNVGGADAMALEAVMSSRGRPALRIKGQRIEPISDLLHPGSEIWRTFLNDHERSMLGVCASTGAVRVRDVVSGRGPWVQGTAWMIGGDCVITNRHVLFPPGDGTRLAQRVPGSPHAASLRKHLEIHVDFAFDDDGQARTFRVTEVLHVAPDRDPLDVAVLRLEVPRPEEAPCPLPLMSKPLDIEHLFVVGHPGKLPVALVSEEIQAVFGSPDERKRVSLGRQMSGNDAYRSDVLHDASTIGGFSGGAVTPIGGKEVGALHYYGHETQGNRAVLTSELVKTRVEGFLPRER